MLRAPKMHRAKMRNFTRLKNATNPDPKSAISMVSQHNGISVMSGSLPQHGQSRSICLFWSARLAYSKSIFDFPTLLACWSNTTAYIVSFGHSEVRWTPVRIVASRLVVPFLHLFEDLGQMFRGHSLVLLFLLCH